MILGRVLGCSFVLLVGAAGVEAATASSCIEPSLGLGPQTTTTPSQDKATDEALRRPMTADELRATLRYLEGLRKPPADRAPGIRPLDDARLGVLLGDIVALLGELHARDFALEIDRGALTPEGLKWVDGAMGAIIGCAPLRFEGRGGLPVYKQSLELVRQFRSQLEPLVLTMTQFSNARFPGRRPPGIGR